MLFYLEIKQLSTRRKPTRSHCSVACPNSNDSDPYILGTDALDSAMGVMLSQVQNGQGRVIAYTSRRYADAEYRYCVTRGELLVVVYGLRQFRVYKNRLANSPVVRSDSGIFFRCRTSTWTKAQHCRRAVAHIVPSVWTERGIGHSVPSI